MAKPPPNDDPDVTDLARYRKAKAKAEAEAANRAAARPAAAKSPKQSMLGSNPRAGLILAIAALVLIALTLGPMLF